MKSIIICSFALFVMLSAESTLAFSTETSKAVRVSSDTWMYTATAEYGEADREVTVPVLTAPSWRPRMLGEYLRYQVRINDQLFAGLDTKGIVLSDAPLVENRYVVPAGESYSFTFFALVTIPGETLPPNQTLDIKLTPVTR